MMENAFNIDSFFGKMVPNFGKNIMSRFNPEENEVIEQIVSLISQMLSNLNLSDPSIQALSFFRRDLGILSHFSSSNFCCSTGDP